MGEIKTQLAELAEGTTHLCGPDEYLITEDHTLADVVRWLIEQTGDDGDDAAMHIMGIVKDQMTPDGMDH